MISIKGFSSQPTSPTQIVLSQAMRHAGGQTAEQSYEQSRD